MLCMRLPDNDRERVCDSSAPNSAHQGGALAENRETDGVHLIQAATKKWLRLKGGNKLPKVTEGSKFNDGVEVTDDAKIRAA